MRISRTEKDRIPLVPYKPQPVLPPHPPHTLSSTEGLRSGNQAQSSPGARGWHPRNSLPSAQIESRPSPAADSGSKGRGFECAPGADADLEDKWAHPELQMSGLAAELITRQASLVEEPGQLVGPAGWECARLSFSDVSQFTLLWFQNILEHGGAHHASR